jgi:hypothetical protein
MFLDCIAQGESPHPAPRRIGVRNGAPASIVS